MRILLYAVAALAFSTSARADVLFIPPDAVSPDNAVPTRDAVIPNNARLVAFEASTSQQGGDVAFTRVHADGSSEALDADVVAADASRAFPLAFIVDLGSALSSAEGVSVQASCDVCGEPFTFTVVDVADTTPPSFEADSRPRLEATRNDSGELEVSGCLPAITDDSQTFLHVDVELDADADAHDATFQALTPFKPTTACATPIAFTVPRADALCIEAGAVDVAGNTSVPVRACADVPPPAFGCASVGADPMASLALLGLVVVLARRRRSPRS